MPVVPLYPHATAFDTDLAGLVVATENCQLLNMGEVALVVLLREPWKLLKQVPQHELHAEPDGLLSIRAVADALLVRYPFGVTMVLIQRILFSPLNLHFLALCGGWPGALAAQHLLRHKNRKQAFQVVFWGTVALNIGALVLWMTTIGG